jgi:hypothetical protein
LAEQFDVFSEGFDELWHHQMRQNNAGYDHAWARQIADKVQYEFGCSGDNDHAGADLASGDMLGDSGSNRWHILHRIPVFIVVVGHACT